MHLLWFRFNPRFSTFFLQQQGGRGREAQNRPIRLVWKNNLMNKNRLHSQRGRRSKAYIMHR